MPLLGFPEPVGDWEGARKGLFYLLGKMGFARRSLEIWSISGVLFVLSCSVGFLTDTEVLFTLHEDEWGKSKIPPRPLYSHFSDLTSTQTWTHTHSLVSPCDNGVMVYMSYLSKMKLQIFKKLLMDKKLLPDSLSITWQQLSRARAETVHFLVEFLPGALAWNAAHEILQKMNQRRICSLLLKELKDILPTLEPMDSHLRKTPLSLTKEECGKIWAYRQHVMEKSLPLWDSTIWSGNTSMWETTRRSCHVSFYPGVPRGDSLW